MSTDSLAAKRNSCNLNFKTAQKMIYRFLTEDRIKTGLDEGRGINHHESNNKLVVKVGPYTKNELAEKLNISLKEFGKLKFPYFYHIMASKISLPLVRLYCATKFVGECEKRKLVE